MKKNKVKKSIYIIITITLLIVFILNIIPKKKYNIDDTIILKKAYINYAWGYEYTGYLFLNDGKIYSFDDKDNKTKTPKTNEELLKESKYYKKLSKKDLKKLKENISYLSNKKTKRKFLAFDAGSNYIEVYNELGTIKIYEKGDYELFNKTKESKVIIKIVNKYIK